MTNVALVTGGTGFVGRRLLRMLMEDGWSTHCLFVPGTEDAVADLASKGVRLHPAVGVSWQAGAAAVDADVVFHLASLFRAEHAAHEVEPLVLSNVLFGCLLLDAVTAAGCRRLVNVGTSWQHYRDAAYDPVCLYAATKQAFEDLAEYYVQARGLDTITLELFDTYGPNDERPKLIPALLECRRTGRPLKLSGGEQKVDLVYVDDVAAAMLAAGQRLLERQDDPTPGEHLPGRKERFAVATGASVSLRELVALIERIGGRALEVAWGARQYRDREVMEPWSGGVRPPGWAPTVTLDEGLRRCLAAAGIHEEGRRQGSG